VTLADWALIGLAFLASVGVTCIFMAVTKFNDTTNHGWWDEQDWDGFLPHEPHGGEGLPLPRKETELVTLR
jgi:hypothetical protein